MKTAADVSAACWRGIEEGGPASLSAIWFGPMRAAPESCRFVPESPFLQPQA